jgi:hypothetical protein
MRAKNAMRNEERGMRNEEVGRHTSSFLVPPSSFLILKWALAAWVLASLLFAHGCHGNEDHELFDAIEWVSGE